MRTEFITEPYGAFYCRLTVGLQGPAAAISTIVGCDEPVKWRDCLCPDCGQLYALVFLALDIM